MKQFRILAALILSMIGGSAMAQQYMIVNLEDGRKVEYRLKDVKEVTFREGARKYVDLGLPSGTLWATCNVGANEPQEIGDYFSWAMTSPWVWDVRHKDITEREKMLSNGIIDGTNHVAPTYDAATANWGEDWRLPRDEEWQELLDKCSWVKTTLDGNEGFLVTGTNGESIFLPYGGYTFWNRPDGKPFNSGNYWSSSYNYHEDLPYPWRASSFTLTESSYGMYFEKPSSGEAGYNIRAVYVANTEEPQTPDTPEAKMEWVDLGLPSGLQWAAYDLGATAPEEYGDYYIWGGTEPYNEETYKNTFRGVSASQLESQGVISNSTLTPAYDAATVVLGEGCRMPTSSDINELKQNTTWAWETLNGVRGMRFTSTINGNSFFVPAAGVLDGEYVDGKLPRYFDTELVAINTSTASGSNYYDLYILIPEKDSYSYNNGNFPNYTTLRHQGRIVRAVRMPQ